MKNRTKGYVYIITNRKHSVLYIGVTSNIERRITEHKNGATKGFAQKYEANKLIYCEVADSMYAAIAREKQLKGWTRKKKVELINSVNPSWDELRIEH